LYFNSQQNLKDVMQQLEFNKTPSPEYSQVKVAFPLMRQSGSEECND
jgi:hypothetical protein